MCSTAEQRLAELGQAIDDLAAEALGGQAMAQRGVKADDHDEVVSKLARLWTLLTELDPDIARRLPTYRLD